MASLSSGFLVKVQQYFQFVLYRVLFSNWRLRAADRRTSLLPSESVWKAVHSLPAETS